MRTIIELSDDQLRALKTICARKRISRAEAIRQAVDRYVEDEECRRTARDEAFKAAFGLWKDRGISTDQYLEEIRSEWDR